MSDYREEIRVSKEILARVVEAYRKIRNTMRYLHRESVRLRSRGRPRGARGCSRKWIATSLRCTRTWARASWTDTSDYDYNAVCQALNSFTNVDLSAFYVDVSKDRLYTFARAFARATQRADGDVRDR